MPHVSSSIVVDRDVADVFAYVAEWSNATEFTEGLVSWAPVSTVTDRVGARFTAVMRIGPTTQRSTLEIVRRDVDVEVAWESRAGFRQKGSYTFATVGAGTLVGFSMDVSLPGGLAGQVVGRLVGPVAQDNTARTLGNLKRILES